jgi:hypothetical protein
MTRSRWRRYVAAAAGIGLIAIVLSGTSAGPAIAQTFKPVMALIVNDVNNPVPTRVVGSTLTHVGRPVSDIVQLTWNSSDTCFKRQSPAGVLESDCYIPPNGRSLVITDVQWRAHYGVLSRPGAYGDVVFVLPSGTIAYSFSALIDAEQFVSGFQGLQTGFVFHPDLLVVPFDAVARVYGYVVPSE